VKPLALAGRGGIFPRPPAQRSMSQCRKADKPWRKVKD